MLWVLQIAHEIRLIAILKNTQVPIGGNDLECAYKKRLLVGENMQVALIYLGRKGGGATYSLEVAKELRHYCFVSPVVSTYAENIDAWRSTGLNPIEVMTYTNSYQFLTQTLNPNLYRNLRNLIREINPDVIYYPMLHLWTPIINLLSGGVPAVSTIHDPILHKGERNVIQSISQNVSIRQSARLILLSHVFTDTLKQKGVSQENIHIIPHGEFSFYGKRRKECFDTRISSHPRLLFFGRISEYKGIRVLLNAFPIIKDKLADVELLIVGEGDLSPYSGMLANISGVTVINKWIPDEEVQVYFNDTDLVVLPYIDGSQSGVIPLAYTFNLPVVASALGGIQEQVVHGETGYLVPPNDILALAASCIELLSDPTLRTRMGCNAYRHAMREWNWNSVAGKVYSSFCSILTGNHAKNV